MNPYRATPRRRTAPRWTLAEWAVANKALHQRSGGRCECCGKKPTGLGTERHHRRRRRDGGDRLANIMWLRRECHAHWTTHPAEARRWGFIVPTGVTDVAAVPLLHRGSTWVTFDDVGTTHSAQPPAPS